MNSQCIIWGLFTNGSMRHLLMTHIQLVTASIRKAKDCLTTGMKAAEIIKVLQVDYASITMPVIQTIVNNAVKNSQIRRAK